MRSRHPQLDVYRDDPSSSAAKDRHPWRPDPQEGARLIRAFLRIADPKVRLAIIEMVERQSLSQTK